MGNHTLYPANNEKVVFQTKDNTYLAVWDKNGIVIQCLDKDQGAEFTIISEKPGIVSLYSCFQNFISYEKSDCLNMAADIGEKEKFRLTPHKGKLLIECNNTNKYVAMGTDLKIILTEELSEHCLFTCSHVTQGFL